MNNVLASSLSAVTFGPEVVVRNLTMIPLLRPETRAGIPEYLTLDEALAGGLTEITELSQQGSVPELRVVNRAPQPVLIVDGEELVGAKQNRVVNLTILVPAASTLTIPVSCVEAGRWQFRSRGFSAAPRTQYATGRAKRMKDVTLSMAMSGERRSDQSGVWGDIAEKCERLGSESPTSAMESMYVDHAAEIDSYVAGCLPVDTQVGAIVAIDGAVVACDLFDRASTLRRVLPKLVRGVAIDAIDRERIQSSPKNPQGPIRPLSEMFLAAAGGAPHRTAKAVGLGDDYRFDAGGITGAALLVNDAVVHFAAFSEAATL